jgi:hypothetical protein
MLASQATFCVMSAISSENPSIIHRLNNQQQQAIPTGLFAYQPDQQFHSTASVQKDDNNNGNSEDNGNVKNTIHDRDEAALLEPKQLREFRSQGRPKCPQCGKPLQDCKKTVNSKWFLKGIILISSNHHIIHLQTTGIYSTATSAISPLTEGLPTAISPPATIF